MFNLCSAMNALDIDNRWSIEFPVSCSESERSEQPSCLGGCISIAQSSGTIPILLFDISDHQDVASSSSSPSFHMDSIYCASARTSACGKTSNSSKIGRSDLEVGACSRSVVSPTTVNELEASVSLATCCDPLSADCSPPKSSESLGPANSLSYGSVPTVSDSLPPPDNKTIAGLMSPKSDISANAETFDGFGSSSFSSSSSSSSPIRQSFCSNRNVLGELNKDISSGKSPKRSSRNGRSSARPSTYPLPSPPPHSPDWSRPVEQRHRMMSSTWSNVDLPEQLSWLHNIYIDLFIDQEGFRAVYPTMKLVGFTVPPANKSSTDYGMAEFMPMKRESFVFHFAALDAPPVMRRLSVNGDETRDFLSQHVHLSLKSENGDVQVYTVRGTESNRAGYGDDDSKSDGLDKLEWQFDYTVEDKRKPDGAKVGHGEKVLTPLRFSCSPGLLHPKQGRKVTVMQVWKKSVQARAFACRVELPKPPVASGSGSPPGTSPRTLKSSFKLGTGYKLAIWNINSHKRPKSLYGRLKENDEFEDQKAENASIQNRRKSASPFRPSVDTEQEGWHQGRRSSAASGQKSRSRSLDARLVGDSDAGIYQVSHRQIMSTEELERWLAQDSDPKPLPSPSLSPTPQEPSSWGPGGWSSEGEYVPVPLSPPPFHRSRK